MDDQELIVELGIENLSPAQQAEVIDELTMKIGEALAADLTEKQLEEFQAIIDGDDEVINAWLAENDPDYTTSEVYQELVEDADDVAPEKMYAYTAWIGVNKPDFQDTVERAKADIKAREKGKHA